MPGIDLCFAEVGIDGSGELEARCDIVEEIQPRFEIEFVITGGGGVDPAPGDEGADVQPSALFEILEARDLAGLRYLEKIVFEATAGPHIFLLFAIDRARKIKAPSGAIGGKVEAFEWNRDFRDPAFVRARGAQIPDGIPVGIQVLRSEGETIDECACWVGGEIEGIALILKGIEQDFDTIVGTDRGIPGHTCSEDLIRLRVEGDDTNVEKIVVVE